MAASLKQRIPADSATLELWRVAETGDVAELARILPHVSNVNARNQHGMTALMRAAYHGHARMVRALLDHGADPNLTRNDKFTALALAAFFGHTETVRILIERGAKKEVVTRCNASAKTWATARTFDEVARCLETQTPVRAPAVVRTLKNPPEIWELVPPVQVVPAPAPAAVKTLKEPPEIWDLVQVHEAPKSFKARSAFVSRLSSMKSGFALGVAAVFLVAAVGVVGALMLRRSQARNVSRAEAPSNPAGTKVVAAETVESPATEPSVTTPATEVGELSAAGAVRNHGSRKVRFRESRARSNVAVDVVENAPSREAPVAPVVVSTPPQTESRTSTKANNSLSPQLITPKSSAPKAKVIQWP